MAFNKNLLFQHCEFQICQTDKNMEVNEVKIRRLIRRYVECYQQKNEKKREKIKQTLDKQTTKQVRHFNSVFFSFCILGNNMNFGEFNAKHDTTRLQLFVSIQM